MAKRLTQEEFEKRIEEQGNGEFTVLEKYKNNRTPTLTRHEVCGHEWKIRPDDFFRGKRCPFCNGSGKRTTQEEFEIKVKRQSGGEYIALEKYQESRTPLLMRHKICGYEWKIRPDDFLHGKGCPLCSGRPKIDTSI